MSRKSHRKPLIPPAPRGHFCEPLEPRHLLSTTTPTAVEQYLLELLNRARANPTAEATRYGIDLNEGLPAGTITSAPKQPLAFDPSLIDSARAHSQEMLDFDYFEHAGQNGSAPQDRMISAGYNFQPPGWTAAGSGENIAWSGTTGAPPNQTTTTADLHEGLFTDLEIPDRGHRLNIMDPDFREVGNGIKSGVFTSGGTDYNAVMITEDFAYVDPGPFLTGVIYRDNVTADSFYTPGEGLGAITITAVRASDNASFSTTTFSTGGYTLPISPGAYTVTASGGNFAPMTTSNVVIAAQNVKVDFTPPPPDTTPPTLTTTFPAINAAAASTTTLTVTYTDPSGIATSTLGDADLIVSKPGGGTIPVHFSTFTSPDSHTAIATYTADAPGGSWDSADNGAYTVKIASSQVSDLANNFITQRSIGTFNVNITAPDSTAPTASLTPISTLTTPGGATLSFNITYADNAAFNISTLASANLQITGPGNSTPTLTFLSSNPTSNAASVIATYRMAAPGGTFNFTDNGHYTIALLPNQITDTSANPAAAMTLGSFDINIPAPAAPAATLTPIATLTAAGTTSTLLTVTYHAANGVSFASLGDDDLTITKGTFSANPILQSTTPTADSATIIATYRLDAPGGTWDTSENGLYAVAINASSVANTTGQSTPTASLGQFTINIPSTPTDTKPPTATLTAKTVSTKGAKSYTFKVTYADPGKVKASTLGAGDVQVTGPHGFKQVAKFISKTSSVNTGAITVTYSIIPSGKSWTLDDNGKYTVSVRANQISDIFGHFILAKAIKTFTVSIRR